MIFLERAIRNGIRKGIGDAVGNAVQKAVEPKATELANKAAQSLDQAAQNTQQTVRSASGLEGVLSNLERSMQGYATEVAKNKKICPQCGQIAGADQKFCPSCGTKLPEQTVAQEAVCPACGKQNSIGTRFCAKCGTKLPAAVAEEQAQAQRNRPAGGTAVSPTPAEERIPSVRAVPLCRTSVQNDRRCLPSCGHRALLRE